MPMPVTLPAPLHVLSGASSDIGQAIACRLADSGRSVLALGRNRGLLQALEERCPGRIQACMLDLTNEAALAALSHELASSGHAVAGLIHCAGVYFAGRIEATPLEELDRMYQANVRAPYQLTQLLLPALGRSAGRVIFINSTAGLRTPPALSGYSASQHSLRVLAESLREESNAQGVLVTSIYLGRTATRRMAGIFRSEQREYRPELLLQPADVADTVLYVLDLPPRVEVVDLTMRPAVKSY
ncbi:MAG: SDR family oxidoreductase [Steroidobacteraceae bacterium]